jgi:hypothetical protein
MYNETLEFVEKVKDLVKHHNMEVLIMPVEVPIRLWIDKARVEVIITAKCRTVTDGQGKRELFEKSLSTWGQMSIEHIENLLTAYKKLGRLQ